MKKHLLLFLFLLLCGVVTAEISTETNNKAYFAEKEAIAFIDQGKYEEAVAKYTEVIELVSDNSKIYFNRAWCYEQLKQYDAAIADLEKAVRHKEDHSEAHLKLAELYYSKGDKEKATSHFAKMDGERERPQNLLFLEAMVLYKKEAFDEALALFRQCAELNIASALSNAHIGHIYFEDDLYDEAVEYLLKATTLKSFDYGSNVYLMLGWSESMLKHYKQAILQLNRYISSGPPVAKAYYHRGMSQLRIHDFTYKMEPLEDFKKALELEPEMLEGAYGIACFHIVAKQYKTAKTLLDSLIKVDASIPEFHVELGKAHAGLKRPDLAHEAFKAAKRLNPRMTEPYLEAGILFLHQNQPEQALQELETALRLAPDDLLVTLYHAWAISKPGRTKEAKQTLDGLLSMSYEVCPVYYKNLAHNFLGMMLLEQGKDESGREHMEEAHFRLEEAGLYYGDWWLQQGDLRNALRIYTASLSGSPFENVELECRVGDVFLKQKKYWDASYAYERAIKIDQDLAEAHLGLGLSYIGIKQYPEAMQALNKAIDLDTNLPEAYYQRALLHQKNKHPGEAIRDLQAAAHLGHKAAVKRLK
ncbi:MAG: tetratricopeptide repeat protein [Bacteroidales bacterium]|nr:tetratricopeptide repeat protein [Bacteroidales bacterium]